MAGTKTYVLVTDWPQNVTGFFQKQFLHFKISKDKAHKKLRLQRRDKQQQDREVHDPSGKETSF